MAAGRSFDQSFVSQFGEVVVVQPIRDGNHRFVKAVVSGFVTANEEDGRASRIEHVEPAQRRSPRSERAVRTYARVSSPSPPMNTEREAQGHAPSAIARLP
jgi:hypothetical protein